jgi:hypothetical protein
MADEVRVSVSLQCDNGNFSDRFAAASVKANQTTQAAAAGVVTVGTAVQTLSLGVVSAPGYAAFRNLATQTAGTHAVFIGRYDGTNNQEVLELQRGMAASTIGLRAVTSTQYTSAARVQYLVLSR